MFRLSGCLLGICLCANAQFFGLGTPADGSRIYFATPLRQKNTTQSTSGKLFQVDSSGLQLILSREEVTPPLSPQDVGALTNAYDLNGASISADGKVFAAGASRACLGAGEFCTRQEIYATTVTTGGLAREYPGHLQVSANGAWAFGAGSNGYFLQPGYLVNVATGEQVALGIPRLDAEYGIRIAATGHAVADDGTAVYTTRGAVVSIHAGEMRRASLSSGLLGDAVLDRSGRTIVFSICSTDSPLTAACTQSIRLVDAAGTGSSLLLSDGYAPSLSDDGGTLLYLSARTGKPQLRIFTFRDSADRQLGSDPDGIAQAILSGDGSTVYAVTLGARLLKISVATRAVQEVVPRTPYLDPGGPQLAPGKLVTLTGVGLTALSFTADPPLPDSLNGIRVTIQNRTAKLLSVAPDALVVLAPPDLVPSTMATSALDVTLTSNSPFDGPHVDVYIAKTSPELLLDLPSYRLLAAHRDWSALVSPANPAQPGEVIHAYALGLGDTSPAVGYGQAAPAREPFARLTTPLNCGNRFDAGQPVEILFQGLAPNLVGVYQIDLRLPSTLRDGDFSLECAFGGIGFGGEIPVQTLPPPQPPEQR